MADFSIPSGSYSKIAAKGRKIRTRPSYAALALKGQVAHKADVVAPAGNVAVDALAKSTVGAVDGSPDGFGQFVDWNSDLDFGMVAFISASNNFGIGVNGFRDGDTIEIVYALGVATFAKEVKN
ncbi:hypothetical protein KOI35_18440 [Actinoplanes bogorensis]|uniref:Uncharacterized protein n=1 Tax=Paractinoplanes bogorensis TaxID=1610840 RepID=A0ABS5YTU6_9ACTN|nr:hypothetical protein [Actinoplanes bogorensis]MBU2665490.1 hypothetical protein [Actinoplanes bogorensis]